MFDNLEYYISKLIKKAHFRAIKNSKIHKSSRVGSGSQIVNSQIDRNSFCGYDCVITNTTIGSFCSIASNCLIGGASHTIDWVSTSPVFNRNKEQISQKYSYHEYDPYVETIIKNDVWIGANCLIKAGVVINTGSVIGMGSVVTKDIPPYEIWAGNPAKFIRHRFDSNIRDKLLQSKWWEFSDEKLTEYANYITDVNSFVLYNSKHERDDIIDEQI